MNDPDPYDMLIDFVTADLVMYLMRDNADMTLSEAVSTLHNTEFYDKLTDRETSLYYRSSAYNYERLKHELTTGRYAR